MSSNNIAVMKLEKDQDFEKKLRELNTDPNVEYAQPNYIYRLMSVNDPYANTLW
jgi:hypothetical protein